MSNQRTKKHLKSWITLRFWKELETQKYPSLVKFQKFFLWSLLLLFVCVSICVFIALDPKVQHKAFLWTLLALAKNKLLHQAPKMRTRLSTMAGCPKSCYRLSEAISATLSARWYCTHKAARARHTNHTYIYYWDFLSLCQSLNSSPL